LTYSNYNRKEEKSQKTISGAYADFTGLPSVLAAARHDANIAVLYRARLPRRGTFEKACLSS